jgi:putative aldouronate transport system substrate-binding protein
LKMRKRSFTVLLVMVFMLVSILAACSNNSAEQQETSPPTSGGTDGGASQPSDQPVVDYGDTGGLALPIAQASKNLKAITTTNPDSPLPENFFTQELAKRTNLNMQIERYKSTDPTEELGLLVASNSLPDIVGATSGTLISRLGEDMFVPINQYLDILPNYSKVLEENPQIMKSFRNADGNLYTFNYLAHEISPKVNYGMIFRQDIFDKHNIALPNGPDEYYEALKKLKEIYPDSYPLINYYGEEIVQLFSQSWGTFHKMFVPDGGNQWEYGPISDEYKDMLVYLAKLYKEGLMDPEFMTSRADRFDSLILQPDAGFVFQGCFCRIDSLVNSATEKIPGFELSPGYFVGPKGKVMAEARVLDFGISVSSKSAHIEDALKLIDYLYSPSGSTLVSMGVEDVTFKVEPDGTISYPELQGKALNRTELEIAYGLNMTGFLNRSDPRGVTKNVSPKYMEAVELLQDPFWQEEQPVMSFTEDEISTKTPIEDALLKAVFEYSTKVIMGTESIDGWDSWVKKNESLGYKKLVDIYNTAYERYNNQ